MSSRRPRRKPGENRERLIEAGLVEFGLVGYHGASTIAIAARADVPQPHVYASFTNKEELFLACVKRAELLLDFPESALPDSAVRFLFQAVASIDDPHLSATLKPAIGSIALRIGRSRLLEVVSAGALLLLEADGAHRN